jgi:hypothetical protein
MYHFFILLSVVLLNTFLSLWADEISYIKAKQQIEAISDHVPNDNDIFKVCSDPNITLTFEEFAKLFIYAVCKQKTSIGQNELQILLSNKRNSIHDIKISYSVLIDNPPNSELAGRLSLSYVFASLGQNLYFEKIGKSRAEDYECSIISYDGNVLRFINNPNEAEPNGTISKRNTLKYFFQPQMPLYFLGLFDASRCDASLDYSQDYYQFLHTQGGCFVIEDQEIANGQNCIVVIDGLKRYFLDPQKDYSIVKFEQFDYIYDSSEHVIGRKKIQLSNYLDYIDYGNSIWIPSKIETIYYSNGSVIGNTIVDIKEVKINSGIKENFFTDVFPENTLVSDAIRNMVYKQSDSPSINSLIKETAKSKRIFIYRYISIISGLALIFIALGLKYRAYLKAKRERENKTEEIK